MAKNPSQITLTADQNLGQGRIDRWLTTEVASREDNFSRSRIKTLILDGNLTVNGKVSRDPATNVISGATYQLSIPASVAPKPKPQAIPLKILFEDEHLIVIDKPAGLVVHPAPGNLDGTLVNALIAHCGDGLTGIGGEARPGIVHRLDKNTSGVMLAAKSEIAHQRLVKMFSAHTIDRVYTALVWGVIGEKSFTINAPVGRDGRARKKMTVTAKGREALTYVEINRILPPLASLVQCRLATGRTHQIRVHLAHQNHGVIGDPLYGRPMRGGQMPDNALREALGVLRRFPRQALHAGHLGFEHPVTGEAMAFDAPAPQDMLGLIDELETALTHRPIKGRARPING